MIKGYTIKNVGGEDAEEKSANKCSNCWGDVPSPYIV